MNTPVRLTMAEAEGLLRYLAGFDEPGGPLMAYRSIWREGSDEIALETMGKPSLTIRLVRVEDQTWNGYCSCVEDFDCGHCYSAAEHLLRSAPSVTPSTRSSNALPAPSTTSIANDLQQRVHSILGREPKDSEMAYLQKLAGIWRSVLVNRQVNLDAVSILSSSGKNLEFREGQKLSRYPLIPSSPSDAIEFLHGIAHANALIGRSLPDFVGEVLRSQPIPESWVKAWRSHELESWYQAFSSMVGTIRSPSDMDATPVLGVRILLTKSEPTIEVRLGESEPWRVAKHSELRRLAEQTQSHALQVETASMPVWYAIARRLRDPYAAPLSYEQTEYHHAGSMPLITVLLGQRAARPSFLCLDGTPVVADPVPVGWKLVPEDAAGEHFALTMCLPDGGAPPEAVAVAQGPVQWLIGRSSVHPVSKAPEQLPSLNRIPIEAITSPEGLRFLTRLKARMPEVLERRIRRIELLPCFEFTLLPGGKSERMQVRILGLGPDGQAVVQRAYSSWYDTEDPVLDRRMKSDGVVVFEQNLLAGVPALIERLELKWDPQVRHHTLRVTKRFPQQLSDWIASAPKELVLRLPPEYQHFTAPPIEASVHIQVNETEVDWFDLSATITAADTDLTPEELQLLLDAKGGFVRIEGKGWRRARISLSPEDEQRLAEMGLDTRSISSEPLRLHALQLAHPSSNRLLPEDQAQHIRRRAEEIQARITPPVPAEIQATLRPYQIEGFHFLAYLSENRFGGVLADDMGLGKTLQTLTWIAWLRSSRAPDPVASRVLVVCPKSVAPNWLAEAAKFLPSLRTVLWHGEDPERFETVLADHDAVILNYAQLRFLEDRVLRQTWLAVILDEAQAIKNPDSQTAQVARRIRAAHRLALTGTPIENRLLDLWSILSFAMPGALGPRAQFTKSFAKEDPLARRRLSARVRPFLLRRTKGQVAQDLPPRIEEDLPCELEGVQQTLYRAEYKKARALLLKLKTTADLDKFRFHFLTSLLRLRQICCHPALVDARQIDQPSAKVEALIELVEPLFEQGLKVLVFSQFTGMLEILQKTFESRGWTSFYLAGDTENRGPLVDSFNAHAGAAAFFISLKAGGFGLNLTSASYVVLFDPWWNPAVENQAIDRTHRIGQSATVFAYRLLVKGSIEEKIRQLQRTKSSLADDVLGEERFSQSLSISDLQFLFSNQEAEV